MKKYNDIDIATHTIMIDGLPKKIPRRELEQKIKKMFTQCASGFEYENVKEQRINSIGKDSTIF